MRFVIFATLPVLAWSIFLRGDGDGMTANAGSIGWLWEINMTKLLQGVPKKEEKKQNKLFANLYKKCQIFMFLGKMKNNK